MELNDFDFRVWDKKNKAYIPLSNGISQLVFDCENKRFYYPFRQSEKTLDNEGLSIEFYTGFKDKNGVKIYEGDKVIYRGKQRGKIIYTEGTWYLVNPKISKKEWVACGISLERLYEISKGEVGCICGVEIDNRRKTCKS